MECATSRRLLGILLLLTICSFCVTADAEVQGTDDDSTTMMGVSDPSADYTAELGVFMVFAFLFAICTSFMTVSVAYFILLEDALMRRFLEEGTQVEAKAVHAPFFVRNTVDGAEYSAKFDYRYVDHLKDTKNDDDNNYGSYATAIRKQIKCLERDIYYDRKGAAADDSNHVYIEIHNADEMQPFPSFDGVVMFDTALPQQRLAVLVLPAYPNSALPYELVRRAVQKSWHATAVLIFTLTAVTLFCIHVGLDTALKLLSNYNNNNNALQQQQQSSGGGAQQHLTAIAIFGISMATTVALLGLELLLILYSDCIRNRFVKALQQDYLDCDDVESKMDDETLATLSTNATISWGKAATPKRRHSPDKQSTGSLTL